MASQNYREGFPMRKIKFAKDYRARNMVFYHAGDTKEFDDNYATVLIDAGVAKAIDRPHRHKMIERPAEKKHYYVG